MADIKELRERRGKLITDARAIIDRAENEGRNLSDDETRQYDALITDQQKVKDAIDREERQINLEREAVETAQRSREEGGSQNQADDLHTRAFRSYILGGSQSLTAEEARALSVGTPGSGGYLVPPEQFISQLIKSVDDMVFIRQRATKFTLNTASSLGVPTLDADPADSDWTTELLTGSEDSTMAFGKRSLAPSPFAKRVKISNKLIQIGALNPESIVRDRLAYKFGITEEKAFMTGDGSGKPLGVFTASTSGISTGRDYATGNAATAPTFDGLIGAKYTLKGGYHSRAAWLFHRDALAIIAKIKDGDGQYIWRESVRAGEPDTLLGFPVSMSEYAPNTFTTGLYVGILGDFSHYWIADALNLQIQRLVELYAETNQIGFIGRAECDGMPVLEEAFVRVKLG